jgi:hypothetical protein
VNRPTHPRNPAGGWQATPGQPIPRAARQPAANGLLLVMLLLVWFSPLSIVAWLLGQVAILLQRRWHWWRFALASLASIGVVLAVTGPEQALRRHVFVPQHFWQYVALHFGFGPPGSRVTVGQFLWDLVATQVWLALPVGLLAASLSVWNAERAAGGAEWSPFVRRRQRIDQRTRDRRTARLVARPHPGRRPGQRPATRGGGGGAMTATIWRTCPSCFGSFEQPDDPGRKRVYCSRACQQAAYRARQRTSAGQRSSRQDWRSEHQGQRRERARSERPGAGQRHHQRQDRQDQQHRQRRPPPGSANGHRPSATGGDELARIRRIIAALLRKAAATSFPHEAAACREKAEALRAKYGL